MTDYKAKLDEVITKIESQVKKIPRPERLRQIDAITSQYVEKTGLQPDDEALQRLIDVSIHEELSDKHVDKMTREEYPIMSDRQKVRRTEGRERSRKVDGTVSREVPLSHAVNVATDGKDYTLPMRSFQNPRL